VCTYGIGLPFDHPIWQSLPPCRCGDNGFTSPDIGWAPLTPTITPQWQPTYRFTDRANDPCGIGHAFIPDPGGIEVRDPDDEIIAHGAWVHVERLDDDRVWLNIRTPNGQDIHIDFYAKKGRKVGMFVRDEGDTPTPIPEPS
jgi:hypothetical protein